MWLSGWEIPLSLCEECLRNKLTHLHSSSTSGNKPQKADSLGSSPPCSRFWGIAPETWADILPSDRYKAVEF